MLKTVLSAAAITALLGAASIAGLFSWIGDGYGGISLPRIPTGEASGARVVRVVDGDTIVVRGQGGERTVRLIGIDTPETKRPNTPVECFGPEASARTKTLLPPGAGVRLERDPTQDATDRYGRQLRYVTRGETSINERLLASGHARVYVYAGRPFTRAPAYTAAETRARAAGRGLWGAR